MNNILRVSFCGKQQVTAKSLYQYDYGQVLKFVDLALPAAYEVHFSNYEHGKSTTVLATSNKVAIPDMYFTSGKDIYVWIYLHTGVDDGETEYQVIIPIIRRAAISDEQPSSAEETIINQTIAALNDALTESRAGIETIQRAENNVSNMYSLVEDSKNRVYQWVTSLDDLLSDLVWEQGVDANNNPVAGAIKVKDFTVDNVTRTNTASGIGALAFGHDNNVTGNYGVGIGITNTVSGGAGIALGGEHTVTANYAVAEGYGNHSTAYNTHAEGYQTNATKNSAHSEGNSTTASGNSSHAEGYNTTASAQSAHAEGYSSEATGSATHAEGYGTHATATGAHAEGKQTTASGNYSHAGGVGTTANSLSQTVFGEYNAVDSGYTASNVRGTYVEIVGNGSDAQNLSNARTLDWNGNEWLAGKVSVGSSSTPPTINANNELTTKKYVDDSIAAAIDTATDSVSGRLGYITIGSTRLTEAQLIKLLQLIED